MGRQFSRPIFLKFQRKTIFLHVKKQTDSVRTISLTNKELFAFPSSLNSDKTSVKPSTAKHPTSNMADKSEARTTEGRQSWHSAHVQTHHVLHFPAIFVRLILSEKKQ